MPCPICGSEKATEVIKTNGIFGPGGTTWVEFYICQGCTVMFKAKEKFFNVDRDEVVLKTHNQETT